MDRSHQADRLHLDDHLAADQQIEAISALQLDAAVHNGQRDLTIHLQAGLIELVLKTSLIRGLEQSRSECRMHVHGGSNDPVRDLVQILP
jgi:hypothetical protein